jgi:hypothetical protein
LTDSHVEELVRTLRSYGVLTRERLRERSGAQLWLDDSFDAALRRGTADGSIKSLGTGLFEVGDDAPDPSEGQFDPT